ncbi:MAG: deoxynucleoside kinase [Nitrospirota bacterium]
MSLIHRYIAIEGPIGVGKTSLAELLAREFDARLILEQVEDNPFLSYFYSDRKRYAFQTQIFFLLSRYRQQQELSQQDLFNRVTITDYIFLKDRVFAYVNLDENEIALYEQIYSMLDEKITKPDLVIYLTASTDVIIERVKQRGREYEKGITREYVEELNEMYNNFFFNYSETPLLVINTSEIDFIKHNEDLRDLARHIRKMRGGTLYYRPMSLRQEMK